MWRAKSLEKTLMLGNIEGRRRRGAIEDEMVGWHHWLNGHECEQTPGDNKGGVRHNWMAEQQQWFQGWFGDSVKCLAFQSKKKGERTIPANSPSSLLLSFFFFFFKSGSKSCPRSTPADSHLHLHCPDPYLEGRPPNLHSEREKGRSGLAVKGSQIPS